MNDPGGQDHVKSRRRLHEQKPSPPPTQGDHHHHHKSTVGTGVPSRSPRNTRSSPRSQQSTSQDRASGAEEFSDEEIESPIDEVDRTNLQHPNLHYPDLSTTFGPLPSSDPTCSKSNLGSPNDTFNSSRSNCFSRTGPRSCNTKEPVTPKKGSPGKKLYPVLNDFDLPSQGSRGASPVLLIFITMVVIVGMIILHHVISNREEAHPKPQSQTKSIMEVYQDLKLSLRLLKQDVSQPRELWVQIISQLGSVMVNDPRQPAVILVVVPQDSKATAACLVNKIATAVQEAFEDRKFVMFDVHSGSHDDALALKMELDQSLKGLETSHAAVIHNIEEVPGKAAMIFHAYCDNDNAPFRQAIIFPVMVVPGNYETVANSRLDNLVSGRLSKIWGANLPEKDVSSIISRIANAPILIRPESMNSIKQLCPGF